MLTLFTLNFAKRQIQCNIAHRTIAGSFEHIHFDHCHFWTVIWDSIILYSSLRSWRDSLGQAASQCMVSSNKTNLMSGDERQKQKSQTNHRVTAAWQLITCMLTCISDSNATCWLASSWVTDLMTISNCDNLKPCTLHLKICATWRVQALCPWQQM